MEEGRLDKEALRIEVKKIREQIPEERRREKSGIICQKVLARLALEGGVKGKKVMAFFSFSSEVETLPVIEALLIEGAELYLPRVRSIRERTMDIVRYRGEFAMKRSAYGILEPEGNETISPSELDFIIVPALAFDRQNQRLGYGGGFYDSILASVREGCLKLGIAFKEQVLERIPTEPHDLPVDLVLSD